MGLIKKKMIEPITQKYSMWLVPPYVFMNRTSDSNDIGGSTCDVPINLLFKPKKKIEHRAFARSTRIIDFLL